MIVITACHGNNTALFAAYMSFHNVLDPSRIFRRRYLDDVADMRSQTEIYSRK